MSRRDRALQRAERLLRRPECRVLAMNLNVLMPLPLWQEEDIYALMEADVRRAAGIQEPLDFCLLRLQAKGLSLAEKYDDLSARLIGADVRSLADRERALRMRLPVLMPDAHTLLQLASKLEKRVVIFGSWPCPLTAADAECMLEERQVDIPDAMYFEHWGAEMNAEGTLVVSDDQERSGAMRVTVPSPVAEVYKTEVPYEALRYLGFRTMMAMSALHPSVPKADWDAYGAFGMYLLSNAMWIADECCREGIERIAFLARDGFLVKAAFEHVCSTLRLPVKTGYARISRQAVFPLHFRTERDLLSLPLLTDVTAHTPRTLLKLLEPVIDMPYAILTMKQYGIELDAPFNGETIWRFIEAYRARLFDEERTSACRAHAAAYLKPLFSGRCAVVDVGYNLRSERIIQDVTGADVLALITHTDSDVAGRRGIEYRTLYGGTPCVSWVAREQFLLENAPMCTGYDAAGPVFAAECSAENTAMAEFQRQALAFVGDMTRVFGEDMARLVFRPEDGCWPFEQFLNHAPAYRMKELSAPVENAFLEGVRAGDDVLLAWRLMQTDARRDPMLLHRMRRAWIRLSHGPGTFFRKVAERFTAAIRRE